MIRDALLRNAWIAQGLILILILALAFAGVGVMFGAMNEFASMFGLLVCVSTLVLSGWSLLLSIRATRNGVQWRWAAIIWLLFEIEFLAPAIVYWNLSNRMKLVPEVQFIVGALMPFIAVTAVFVFAAAALARISKRRTAAIVLVSCLYLPWTLAVAPASVYLLSVVKSSAPSKYAGLCIDAFTPNIIRDNLDRILAKQSALEYQLYHHDLCERGNLSRQRVLENLNSSNGVEDTCYGLENFHPDDAIAIGVEMTQGAVRCTDENRRLVKFLAANGSMEQIIEVTSRIKTVPDVARTAFADGLSNRKDRVGERIAFHRLCTEPDILVGIAYGMHRWSGFPNRPDGALWSRGDQLVADWAYIKSTPDLEARSNQLILMVKSCRKESSTPLRRLCATALADVLKIETHDLPYADRGAENERLAAYTVTPEEKEEIESICEAAEAEAGHKSFP